MQFSQGWIVRYAETIKKAVNIPVIAVNRITEPLMADQIIRLRRADVVVMGHASLADPNLPEKSKHGNTDDVRRCIGCIVCDASLVKNDHICCSVNPALSYEYEEEPQPAIVSRKVLIVGAGSAGMEAARVAAESGHDVQLYEKRSYVGGKFASAAFPPYKGELTTFLSWQRDQCEKQGVRFFLNTELTPDIVTDRSADVVNAEDILLGVESGMKILVVGGGSVGVETACHLGLLGKNVAIAEMRDGFSLDEDARIRE
jgi:NADPH-dependent 2,4-dienoyl-CoA reductase/sulfur reductase-like enzyme